AAQLDLAALEAWRIAARGRPLWGSGARNPDDVSRRGGRSDASAGLREVLARDLEEALHGRLLAAELLRHLARLVRGVQEEVLEAALGVVRQRIHAHDVLLGAG